MCNCNCNNNHRVVTVTYTGTTIELTLTDSNNIGNEERFNIICCKPVSVLVPGDPVPVVAVINGVANVPLKNSLGLPLMSNVVPKGRTSGVYVVDESGTTPEPYVILETPCYA